MSFAVTPMWAKGTERTSVFGPCTWICLLHFQIGSILQTMLMSQTSSNVPSSNSLLVLYAHHQASWVEINHHTQFVTTKIILSRILSTKPGNLIETVAESAGSALLVMKTGTKVCSSRSCLYGAQPANIVTRQLCKRI